MDPDTPTPEATGDTTDTPAPQPDMGSPLQAEVDKWKALSRKHETDWKRAQSEIADLRQQLSAKDGELQTRDTDLLRYRVGLAAGVPVGLIERLKGGTEAELLADAKGLLESIPTPTAGPAAPPPTPVTPDQGGAEAAFEAFMKPAFNP